MLFRSAEVAVAIRIGSDAIRALLGSGFRAKRDEFAYMGPEGEGIRTKSFISSHFKPTLAVSEFSQMSIASSDSWLPDFLKQYGNKTPAQIKQNVRRTEEATQPGIPAVSTTPAAPAAPVPAVTPEIPAQASLTGGLKLAEAIEEFLG